MPWEEAEGCVRIADALAGKAARTIGVVIGPEGGIAPEEVAQVPGERVTLGPRILRTETASVAVLSVVMSLWGDI